MTKYNLYISEYNNFIAYCNRTNNLLESTEVLSESLKDITNFIKNVAEVIGTNIKDLTTWFMNTKVYKFFSKIGWSLSKLFDLVKKGYGYYKQLLDAITQFIANNPITKWGTEKLKQLDAWLQKNPTIKKFSGVAVGALLIYIWFKMGFSGDFEYDFDMSFILNAIMGSFSLAQIFGGAAGIKLLLLIVTGAFGLGFPWPGPAAIQFVISMIRSISHAIKKKFTMKTTKARLTESHELISDPDFNDNIINKGYIKKLRTILPSSEKIIATKRLDLDIDKKQEKIAVSIITISYDLNKELYKIRIYGVMFNGADVQTAIPILIDEFISGRVVILTESALQKFIKQYSNNNNYKTDWYNNVGKKITLNNVLDTELYRDDSEAPTEPADARIEKTAPGRSFNLHEEIRNYIIEQYTINQVLPKMVKVSNNSRLTNDVCKSILEKLDRVEIGDFIYWLNIVDQNKRLNEDNNSISEFDKVVSALVKSKIKSTVVFTNDNSIKILLGYNYPEKIANKVFDILEKLKINASVSADYVGRQEIRVKNILGGVSRLR